MFDRTRDFIKSFLYYPKMVKFFKMYDMTPYDIWKTPFRYAWWHCHTKWPELPENHLFVDDLCVEKENWIPTYRKEPIPKGNVCYASIQIKIKED